MRRVRRGKVRFIVYVGIAAIAILILGCPNPTGGSKNEDDGATVPAVWSTTTGTSTARSAGSSWIRRNRPTITSSDESRLNNTA
jgi:hypothetical protein